MRGTRCPSYRRAASPYSLSTSPGGSSVVDAHTLPDSGANWSRYVDAGVKKPPAATPPSTAATRPRRAVSTSSIPRECRRTDHNCAGWWVVPRFVVASPPSAGGLGERTAERGLLLGLAVGLEL